MEKKRKAAEANSAAVVAVSTAVAKKSNKGNLKWEKKEQNEATLRLKGGMQIFIRKR